MPAAASHGPARLKTTESPQSGQQSPSALPQSHRQYGPPRPSLARSLPPNPPCSGQHPARLVKSP